MDGEPLHRLRGERCEQCGSRRYYLQEGFRYCENGHQLEGVQYMDDETGGVIPGAQTTHKKKAATDEEDAGDIGNDGYESTTASGGERRSDSDSEASRKKAGRPRKLKGNAARELYLECLQLILRHQIWHLVKVRNCPDNIEGIARALWSLRVRDCPNLRPRAFAGDRLYESDSDRGRWPAADEQQQQEAEQRQGKGKETERGTVLPITWRRRKKKKNKTGKATDSRTSEGNISSSDRDGGSRGGDARDEEGEWQLPRLVDSLAIAYLACVLASVPIRIGDLTRWATNGELCFLAQVCHDTLIGTKPVVENQWCLPFF